jgi:Tfp pilus assembly protein PilF
MKLKFRTNLPTLNRWPSGRSLIAATASALALLAFPLTSAAQTPGHSAVRILQIQGTAEVMPEGSKKWILTQTNQVLSAGDRLRTGPNSRVTLRWSDQSVVPFGALSEIEILQPDQPGSLSGLKLVQGLLSFFHRDQPGRIRVLTRGAAASIRGTEFVMEVRETNGEEHVSLAVIDGEVQLENALGSVTLTNLEQAIIAPGQPPLRTAGFIANNLLQWCFYYPGVLDLNDLALSDAEIRALHASLEAYRAGDLLGALAKYPADRQPASDAERIYHAALLLAVGQVQQTEAELNALPAARRSDPLPHALQTLIAAVKRSPTSPTINPQLSTELLAASYHEQSRATGEASLKTALDLARRATAVSPQFGFAWVRVAELEFGFGHTREAATALERGLEVSPRNAQALALQGFILAGRNQITKACEWFDRAIAADAALGNAWLGRGLCRIRKGHVAEGRNDLLVAAALEPQRSLLRSYLGKAFADAGETDLANKELGLALHLDPNDPTGWLYAALLKQQQNRINEAIGDLEQSQQRNDNRALFRSQMLLDQDKAVRSANLASLYRDAGMSEVGLREAARAVTYDYANDSAHLFLSDSFNELRDPTRFNLRHETVWFNELLLANLLAPVGAGRLSQTVTANEYSKLFESDGLGLANETSWRSDDQFRQLASQYGTFGNTAWALDLDYQHNAGVRPNNELDRLEWYTTIKQQLTPQDSVLLLAKYQDYHSGDNFQYYDPLDPTNGFRPNFKFEEHQEPILIGGYQHEWSPGIRTLLLGGRLVNEQEFSDLQAPQLLLFENPSGVEQFAGTQPFDVRLTDDLEIYTAELNQIVQQDRFTLVAGALWQSGEFDFANTLNHAPSPPAVPFPPSFLTPVNASFSEPYQRFKAYGYLTVEPLDKLWLTAGVAYDQLTMPANFRSPPQSAGTEDRDLLGPKAALVWSPVDQFTLRGIYAKSLGGVSLDESYRLEPTQLAGFAQSFRTVIPESVVGSVAAPETEVMGGALDFKFGQTTFAGLQYEHINSDVERSIGVFRIDNAVAPYHPSTTREYLDYTEQSFGIGLNQLLGEGFALGLNYRLTRAELRTTLPEIPISVNRGAARDESATLHRLGGYLLFNHSSGFFARFDANYYRQFNDGYSPNLPGDAFVQLDLQAGYRFFRRRAEFSIGVLNLTDQDYRLNPLTMYQELPRERVFAARFSFRF